MKKLLFRMKVLFFAATLLMAIKVKGQTPYQKLFWIGYNPTDIESINFDGSGRTLLYPSSNTAFSLEIDVPSQKMYWSDVNTNSIMRANLDGTNATVFIAGVIDAQGISMDFVRRKLYWSNTNTSVIESINLDGTGRAVLVSSEFAGQPKAIKVDATNQKLYWFDHSAYAIKRINLDGTGGETFISNSGNVMQFDIDEVKSKLYWPNWGLNYIEKINLDGTGRTTVLSGFSNVGWPLALAIDKINDKIYWWDGDMYRIRRINTDGTNIQTLLDDIYSVSAMIIPTELASAPPQIAAASCGTTIEYLNTQYISAEPVADAQQYEFRIVNGGYTATAKDDLQAGKVRMLQFAGYEYGVTYQMSVRVKVDGVWSDFGPACSITTTTAPHSEIEPAQCGTTLAAMNSAIYTSSVNGATQYRFRIVNGANVQTIDRPARSFNMSMLASYEYNTTYTIDVAVELGGTWHPYSTACNITTPVLGTAVVVPVQCGTTLASASSSIFTNAVTGATQYRFRIVNGANVQTIDKTVNSFKLTELPLYNFSTTYTVDAAIEYNGIWQSYGAACNITTPAVPLTQVQASQCGATLAAMSTYIYANSVSGATTYRFRITEGANVQTIDRSTRAFNMTMLSIFKANTIYQIEVAAQVNGVFGAYGNECNITTPAVPTQVKAAQCGTTLAVINKAIYADPVDNATGYRFRVTNGANVQTIDRTTNSFYLTQLPNYSYNTTYIIEAAVQYAGIWQRFGNPCNITTPAAITVVTTIEPGICGTQVSSNAQTIPAVKVVGATQYEFLVTNTEGYSQSTINNNFTFNFTQLTGLISGATYNVKVRVKVDGEWGNYGAGCNIQTYAPASRMAARNNAAEDENLPDINTLKIGNILTPNGDGNNDFWIVEKIDQFPANTVKIVNNSGKVMFTMKGYDNSWNGSINGTPLDEGTYYYTIDFGNNKPVRQGFITVVREKMR